MKTSSRTGILVGVLALAAIVLFISENRLFGLFEPDLPSVSPVSEPMTELLARLYEAEQVDDPVARCQNYPLLNGVDIDVTRYRSLCEGIRDRWDYAAQFELLNEERWEDVEQLVDDALDNYLQTGEQESRVFAYLNQFGDDSYWSRTVSQAWIEARPSSPVALVARASVLGDQAATIRWGRPLRRLLPEERTQHDAIVGEQNRLLKQALELDDRFLPAIESLMTTAAWKSRALWNEYYEMALAVAPASYYVHATYLHYLKPQWYGSIEAMSAYVEASRARLSARNVDFLETIVVVEKALERRMEEQWEEAVEIYDQGLSTMPTAYLWWYSASASEKMGDSVSAFHRLSLAANAGIGNTHGRQYERARKLIALGEEPWASRVLADLVQRFPSVPEPYGLLASLNWRAGRHQEAIALHERVLGYHPDFFFSHQQLASIHIFDIPRLDIAKPHIDAMLELDPESQYGWLYLVNYLEDTGGDGLMEASQSFLRFVDRDDPRMQFSINYVEAYLEGQAN